MLSVMSVEAEAAFAAFRQCSLSLPGAEETYPWGEVAWRVSDRTFAFASRDCQRISVKATTSRSRELEELPHVEACATSGQYSWLTIDARCPLSLDSALQLIRESYRLVVHELPEAARTELLARAER